MRWPWQKDDQPDGLVLEEASSATMNEENPVAHAHDPNGTGFTLTFLGHTSSQRCARCDGKMVDLVTGGTVCPVCDGLPGCRPCASSR